MRIGLYLYRIVCELLHTLRRKRMDDRRYGVDDRMRFMEDVLVGWKRNACISVIEYLSGLHGRKSAV